MSTPVPLGRVNPCPGQPGSYALEGVEALIVGQSSCLEEPVVRHRSGTYNSSLIGLEQQDIIGVVVRRPGGSLIVDAIETGAKTQA